MIKMKNSLVAFGATTVLSAIAASPVMAASSYQNTCSNTGFVYNGNDAALSGICLRHDATPNKTTLTIKGVSNQNGELKLGSGASTFQKSCGSIQIKDGVIYADCRQTNGMSRPTSLVLPDIANNNGELVYD